jgi:hypothetical protein
MPPTRLIIPTVLAAALLVPSAAGAKELSAAKVCGADRCATFHGHATLEAIAEGGNPANAPQRRAAFYTVRLTVKVEGASDGHWSIAYLPSAGRIRAGAEGEYSWMDVTPAGRRAFARVTRGLAPFPATRLPRVAPEPPTDQGGAVTSSTPTPLAPTAAPDTGGGFPWGIAALIVAAGTAAGAALWRLRRRWSDAPHAPAAG